VGEVERSAQRLACRRALPSASECRAEIAESSCELELGRRALEDVHGLAKEVDALVAAGDETGGAQGNAERSRHGEPSCR
jgi:hypothetical protein